MRYQDVHELSVENPRFFWRQKMNLIDWFKEPDEVLSEEKDGSHRWFKGGQLNTCHLALDYHVDHGRGRQIALFYDSASAHLKRRYTYRELRDEVALFAGVLKGQGVSKGDRVIIYMPMVPEAVISMLACARLGAVHSVVFGGFAPHELAVRIDDARPKVLITASCGLEFTRVIPYKPLVDAALEEAQFPPEKVIVFPRPQAEATMIPGRDLDWHELMHAAEPAACVPVDSGDPLYILYTSGTTGKPKGVVRDNGGHAVALKYSMKTVYNINPGEVFWAASDVGWVVGPQLHRLRAADPRLHHRALRGQAGAHPRRGGLLAGDPGVPGQRLLHRADRVPGHQEGGPGRPPQAQVRHLQPAHPVPGRRAPRSAHLRVAGPGAGRAHRRPLVADRDRLAHRGQPHGPGAAPGQGGLGQLPRARLQGRGAGRRGPPGAPGRDRQHRAAPAPAAGLPAHPVERSGRASGTAT